MEYMKRNFDIFGNPVSITINRSPSSKTILGLFLSFTFVGLVSLVLFLFGQELVTKSNPNFYSQNQILDKYPPLVINNETFPMKFTILDVDGNYVNYSNYLDLVFVQYLFEFDEQFTTLNYTKIPLNLEKVNGFLTPSFDYNLIIEGFWTPGNFSYFSFQIFICNQTKNPNCKTQNEIFDFIGEKGLNINFYLRGYSLDVKNYSFPLKNYTLTPYKFLTNQKKFSNFLISNNTLNTDNGVLFPEFSSQSYLSFEEQQTDTSLFSPSDMMIYGSYFYSSNVKNTNNRSYTKLQDVLAKVSGVMNIIHIIFMFLNRTPSKIVGNVFVMNQIFRGEKADEDGKKMNSSLKINRIVTNSNVNPSQTNFNNTEEQKSGLKMLARKDKLIKKDSIKKKENISIDYHHDLDIKFSFAEWIQIFICKNNDSKNLKNYNILVSLIEGYSDLVSLIKKMEEIENLKKILLDEDQLKLFNSVKSKIRENNDHITNHDHKLEPHQLKSLVSKIERKSNPLTKKMTLKILN